MGLSKEADPKNQNRLRLVILLLIAMAVVLLAAVAFVQGPALFNAVQAFLPKPALPTATRVASSAAPLTPTPAPTATLVIAPQEAPPTTAVALATPPPTVTVVRTVTPTVTASNTLTPTVSASPKPAGLRGSIAYHKNENGIDKIISLNLWDNSTTPLVDVGDVTDLQFNTHAPIAVWSPDSTRLAYVSTFKAEGAFSLRVVDFASNSSKVLYTSRPNGGLFSPAWSTDSKQIAFVELMRLNDNQTGWSIHMVNADGTLCANKATCEIRSNNQGEQYHGGLSWSAQGLLAVGLNSSGGNDIYSLFADGSAIFNLTNHPADDSLPAWSPDGKLIAFTSTRDGHYQIYLMDAYGGNVRRVSRGDATDFAPTWSPDGNWIAYTSVRDGAPNIYLMDLNGNNVTRLTTDGGDRPAWSW